MAASSDLKFEYKVTNVALGAGDTYNVTLMATETLAGGAPGYVTAPAVPAPGTGSVNLVVDHATAKSITPGDVFTVTLAKK